MRPSPRLVRPARSPVRRRFAGVTVLVAILAHVLMVVPGAQAGAVYPNPPNATPVAWPSSFTSYTSDTGTPITDVEGESGIGSTYDISSAAGTSTSVFLAVSSGAAFFRVRIGSDPVDTSKGGFTNATWLVLLATEDSPGVWTTKAVSGIDGKPVGSAAAPDNVYVGNAPGTGIQQVYQFNTVAPAFDPTNAVGTGVRVVSAGSGQYYIDWQVPVSTLVTASGGAITASTPVRLFFGSSAAANLATINKDYMTGSAVSFNGLATVSLSSPTLDLTQSKSLVSGPNPPAVNQTSTYDITVTAHNAGGSNLFSPSIVVTMPAGVSIVSESTSTGSIGAVGQTVTWSPGTMAGGGATLSATIRVSVTPGVPDVGTTLTLANAAAGSGSDGVVTITATGTAQTAGPVAAAPHTTTTSVSCPAGPIGYGGSVVCTITVTDVESPGATVPTGAVTLSPTLGTSSACSLSAATATSASCTVTFTATGVGSGSLGGSYAGDATHASSSGSSGSIAITPATLTVTTVAAAKTYGDPNPAFGVTYAGFVNGDDAADLAGTLTFTTAATAASGAGSYAVTPAGLTSPDYAITFLAANLTVTPASLTISADDQSRPYGAANPALTVAYAGFVNGDGPADLAAPPVAATSATAASPVGTYPITASGAASPNYTIGYVPGTLTVTKATLTLTPLDDAVAIGDPIPSVFAYNLAGFVNGEDGSVVSGAPSCSTDATTGSPAGAYTITCTVGTLSAANYDIVVGGTAVFTVGPVTLTVSVDDASRAYGAPNPAFGVTYAGFVNGDDAGDLGGSLAFGTAATPASPVGTYPVSASGLTSADYVFDYQPGTLTVTPATPVIVWSDPASIEYGTALGASQLDALANVPGTYVYGPPAGAILGAGTHTLTVTFTPTDTTNYVSVSATVELEVVPADQTIDFPALPDVSTDAGPISLAATASSGLAVSYSVSGPCEVVGSTLTITGPGTCVVTASQPGDANHEPADPVSQSFDIDDGTDQPPPPPPTSTGGPSIDTDKDTLPAGDEVIVTATGFDPGSTVEVRILPDGDPVQVVADAEGTIEVAITIPPGTAPGSLQIEATGVDPDGGALTLTATVTVSALVVPDTSTVALPAISDRTGPPAWGLILAVLGLLLLAVAIGVRASAPVAARRRERPRPH